MKGDLAALERPAGATRLAQVLRRAVQIKLGRGGRRRSKLAWPGEPGELRRDPQRATDEAGPANATVSSGATAAAGAPGASGTAGTAGVTTTKRGEDKQSAGRTATEPQASFASTLTPEQDRLWRKFAKRPSDERRNRLVEIYQPLVREVVQRFAARLPRNVDRGDLSNAGNMGLIAAVGSFDRERGVRFEAYAELRIRGALLDELRIQDWLPRPWRQRLEQHKRTVERLRSEQNSEPHDDDVAEALGLGREQYQSLFGIGLPGVSTGVMTVDEDGERAAEVDGVADTRADSPEERISNEELLGLVSESLTEQEFRLLYLRYWQDLPLREIGEQLRLSESRVSKIHSRLIERLADRFRLYQAG